jgi:hypothetical protein
MKKAVNWYNPGVLLNTGIHTFLSGKILKYSDVRFSMPGMDKEGIKVSQDLSDECWVDFMADTGDAGYSTLTVAHSLALAELEVEGTKLPGAETLIIGGDAVYPYATKEEYDTRFRFPFDKAFGGKPDRSLLVLPGNHDWYDGLSNFLKFFCQKRGFGRWRTDQKRSYFAKKVSENWWIWGMDIQLHEDIDGPQLDYFNEAISLASEKDNIILCTAEPSWAFKQPNVGSDRLEFFCKRIIDQSDKKLNLAMVLAGDLHHYSRYEGKSGGLNSSGKLNLVTSGGGGAFTHPTHNLPLQTNFLGTTFSLTDKLFPGKKESRWEFLGLFKFPFKHPLFCAILGGISFFTINAGLWALYLYLILWGALGFAGKGYRGRCFAILIGVIHGFFQFALQEHFTRGLQPSLSLDFAKEMIMPFLEISVLSGYLMATYLFFSNFLRMHDNESFSALRLEKYKGFLRINLKGNEAKVYAVGIPEVPRKWKKNPESSDFKYLPNEPISYKLIDSFEYKTN